MTIQTTCDMIRISIFLYCNPQAQDAQLVQHVADRAGPLRHLLQRRLPHGDGQEVLRGGVQERI